MIFSDFTDGARISGESGSTITLQYTINNTNFMRLQLSYNNIPVLSVYETKILEKPEEKPNFLDFDETKKSYFHQSPVYRFTFRILQLDWSVNQGE